MGDESQALTCYIVKPTRIYDLLKITSIVMRHTVGRYLQGRVSMETVMEPFSIHLLLLLPLLCLSLCVCCMCRYVSDFSSDWLWTTSFGSLSPLLTLFIGLTSANISVGVCTLRGETGPLKKIAWILFFFSTKQIVTAGEKVSVHFWEECTKDLYLTAVLSGWLKSCERQLN